MSAIELLKQFIDAHPELWNEDIGGNPLVR